MKLIILATILCLWSGASWAATMTVTANAPDVIAANGTCSLREAISAANANSANADCPAVGGFGSDTITLPAGTYTIAIASTCEDGNSNGDYDIFVVGGAETLTINGAGIATTVINGGDVDRVFDLIAMTSSPTVNINDLTITNGTAQAVSGICGPSGDGGGARLAAGTALNLSNVLVSDNDADEGGGVFNNGDLSVQDSTISGNDAADRGGGLFNADSGIEVIERTTISGNSANSDGGGIYDNNDPSGVTETTRVVESTISGNDANSGGGVYADANTDESLINIINSTISGNIVAEFGGGVFVCYGTVNLRNVTVTNNTAGDDGGGVALPSCGQSVMNLRNSIVAGNADSSAALTPDCFQENPSDLFTEDFNLIGDETGCDGLINGASDQVGTSGSPINPRLGPLADNGGPTLTHALLLAPTPSPAIDTANSAGCFSNDANNAGLLSSDQRGSPRPLDGGVAGPSPDRCDIGAFEVGGCGDGFQDPSEACDDGNTADGDGCSATCELESCGDGVVQAPEQCDDGNAIDGDGCSANCTTETTPPDCGDGTLDSGEQCDDGNSVDGDGCSANCTVETGFDCGDGSLDAGEECDDGNNANGDGCSSSCEVETGFACTAKPGETSDCKAGCGNGIPAEPEQCDDGNNVDGDGCSAICRVETAAYCATNPTNCVIRLLGDGGCSLIATPSSAAPFASALPTILLLASAVLVTLGKIRRS